MGGPQEFLEVEIKLAVDESVTPPDLTAVEGIEQVLRTTRQPLSALYYDTADLRLTREKITLRRREGGNDDGWHLKLPGEQGRIELRVGLDAGDAVPAELIDQVRAIVRNEPLQPIAQVDNERTETIFGNSAGEDAAEFCDDHVHARSLLDGGEATSWREWELELADAIAGTEAGSALLQQATDVLCAAGAKRASSPSKLLTALGPSLDTAPLPPHLAGPTLAQTDSLVTVLERMHKHRESIVNLDRDVRADADDSVHQMRVATRELRSLLTTFAPLFGKKNHQVRALESGLKDAAKMLGKARDAEVVHARFIDLVERDDSGLIDPDAEAHLRGDMVRAYVHAHEDVITMLNSDRYLALLDALDAFLKNPPRAEDADPQHLRKLLKKALKKLKKRHQDTERSYHDVRKAVKRLRYAARAVDNGQPVFEHLTQAAKATQSLLGTYQDTVTSREQLLRLAREAEQRGESSFAYGLCYQREADAGERALIGYEDSIRELLRSARRLF